MAVDQRLVWGGIAVGGAGIAIYMYRKNKKQQAAAAQAQAQSGYGYGYGLQLTPYGYGQTYSPYGYGFGPFGLGAYGGSGQYGYGYYGAGVPAPVPQQATTNAQWSEAAVSALTSAGYNAQTVLAALGKYLTGGNLSQDEAGIISAAIAAEGYPPQSGANGFPPQMNVGGANGGTGQGGSGGSTPANTVMVPFLIGATAGDAHNELVYAGLRPTAPKGQRAFWIVTNTSPTGGTQVPLHSAVRINASAKRK